jgi:hypothetical protein
VSRTSGSTPDLLEKSVGARETERRDLRAKLEHLNGLAIEADSFDLMKCLEDMKGAIENLRSTLEADPAVGRQVLRRLLDGPIKVTPTEDVFEFSGKASFAKFDPATFDPTEAMQPVSQALTGHIDRRSQRWCPRGDSNTRHAV